MFFFFSPLEQFAILKLFNLSMGNIDISFTNSALMSVLTCLLAFFFLNFASCNAKLLPHAWQSLIELFYTFVFFNIVSENIKKKWTTLFPCVFLCLFVRFCL